MVSRIGSVPVQSGPILQLFDLPTGAYISYFICFTNSMLGLLSNANSQLLWFLLLDCRFSGASGSQHHTASAPENKGPLRISAFCVARGFCKWLVPRHVWAEGRLALGGAPSPLRVGALALRFLLIA